MHGLSQTCHEFLVAGMIGLFAGQLLWFVAGGTYNALCCRARGQSALAWIREIPFVHLHALLPPVRHKGRIAPRVLRRRYPSAPWWYRAAVLGMLCEMLGLLIALLALGTEAVMHLGQTGPLSLFYGAAGCPLVATVSQICSLA